MPLFLSPLLPALCAAPVPRRPDDFLPEVTPPLAA